MNFYPSSWTLKSFVGIAVVAAALALGGCTGNGNDNDNAEEATVSPTAAPSETPAASPAPAEPSQTPLPSPSEETGADKPDIGAIVQDAKEGKVPGCDYAAHIALYDEIEKEWGKADRNDMAGKGMYAVYEDRGITFGYNKGMVVFDVRSYASDLKTISLEDIEAALGKADEQTANGGDDIYVYQVNDQYQLKFVIPEKTGKVDHISVFSPQDTKNNMAG